MDDKRFVRTKALLGDEAMQKIYNSCVMVIGAGAVGGYVIETLARIGVGKIIVVDFDEFDITNINRQIFATTSTIGMKKTLAAKNRINDINPNCEVVSIDMFVKSDNVQSLLDYKPDFIVDAIDSLNAKCNLIEALVNSGCNFISSMGAARKLNPFLIKIGGLNKTLNCALARFIRKRLKRRGVDISKVNCVYSTELPKDTDLEVFGEDFDESVANRLPIGSMPTITAMFGLLIADTAVKQIVAGSI